MRSVGSRLIDTRVTKRSAGVVVVRRFDGAPRCLLLRCYGYWDFPKGEVEPGEEPLQTARREVTEETGLRISTFDGAMHSSRPRPTPEARSPGTTWRSAAPAR